MNGEELDSNWNCIWQNEDDDSDSSSAVPLQHIKVGMRAGEVLSFISFYFLSVFYSNVTTECIWRDDGERYAGKIKAQNEDGTFVFLFDDGDIDKSVEEKYLFEEECQQSNVNTDNVDSMRSMASEQMTEESWFAWCYFIIQTL